MTAERTAPGDPENECRKPEGTENEVGLKVDALNRSMREQGRLGLEPAAADRDHARQVRPAVKARAEERGGGDQRGGSDAESAERLAEHHRDCSPSRGAKRAKEAAGGDNPVAMLPRLAGVGAMDCDFGEHRVDFVEVAEGYDLMVLLLLAVACKALEAQFVPVEPLFQPSGDKYRRLHPAHRQGNV